jgi:cytoskeletal protein CcmA (bactofilin family)
MSKNAPTSMTFIGEGTRIMGDMSVEHDLRVEGSVQGSVSVGGTLVLSVTGSITGDVVARSAALAGRLNGNVHVQERLMLENKSVLLGDLRARELVVQEGAIFQGNCAMEPGREA